MDIGQFDAGAHRRAPSNEDPAHRVVAAPHCEKGTRYWLNDRWQYSGTPLVSRLQLEHDVRRQLKVRAGVEFLSPERPHDERLTGIRLLQLIQLLQDPIAQ